MKRIVLLALAALAAALIVGAALAFRQQNPAAAATGIALLPEGLTPSPVPTGLLPQPQAVPFPGTVTAVIPHDFFPLSGAHATLPCAACHDNSIFAGIGAACIDCHAADDVHNGANGLDCALCHVPTQWQDATFDHSVVGQRDCGQCHSPPPNHFPGACSTCHIDTMNFLNISFDHSTVSSTDCAACHSPPPNHFPGACSSCHVDTTNFFNVTFDHTVIGNTDCAACHSPPPNHFPGACSSCHMDTSDFRNVNFAHTFPLDHGDANGQCAACHAGNNTSVYTCTACHEQNEMIEEHADEDIFDIANCVACHADGEKPDD